MAIEGLRRNLLWVDGCAGAIVGVAVLLLSSWLSPFYELPRGLLTFMGLANLVYASYSLTLAARETRPMSLILFLVAANSLWATVCVGWAVVFWARASLFGLAHLVGEGLLVGGLAALEWRWRAQLLRPTGEGRSAA